MGCETEETLLADIAYFNSLVSRSSYASIPSMLSTKSAEQQLGRVRMSSPPNDRTCPLLTSSRVFHWPLWW